MIESTLPADAIENADANDPIEPTDRADPIEPIDSTEPLQPMHRNESSDHSDSDERFDFATPETIRARGGLPRAANSESWSDARIACVTRVVPRRAGRGRGAD